MIIGIPRESTSGETRVAATPQTVEQLIKLGYSVVVESGAGAAASFLDDAYVEAGAANRFVRPDVGSRHRVRRSTHRTTPRSARCAKARRW